MTETHPPTVEQRPTTAERLIAAGHKPCVDEDGEIDSFAIDFGFHNGPACSVCGEGRCEHCDDGSPFEPCPGEEVVERQAKERRRAQWEKLSAEFDTARTAELEREIAALREALENLVSSARARALPGEAYIGDAEQVLRATNRGAGDA